MNPDKNRKRIQDLKWIAFQSISAGIVLIMVLGLFCFILLNNDPSSRPNTYLTVKGLGFMVVIGVFGLVLIVRGIIYFIRALSGDEKYAKDVEGVIDKIESGYEAMLRKKTGNASMYNVLVLLCWVFIFLAIAGAIAFGYSYLTRPR